MEIFSRTDKGMVRSSNQDAELHGTFAGGDVWAVVCDGMGGANGGSVASSTAVEEIARNLRQSYRSEMSGNAVRDMLGNAIKSANIKVYIQSQEDLSLRGMGTTVVAVIISGNTAYIAHAGDSRAYLLTQSTTLRQLTTDHSVVQAMVDRGELTADEARHHPRKNLITRALGVKPKLDIDYCECPFADGDILLMCSDGLSNCVEEREMCDILRSNGGQAAVDKLIDTANKNGGSDNITAVALCC